MSKQLTADQKVLVYEEFLHKINSFIICGESEGIKELIQNADNWSYAHRSGNGEISEEEQESRINNAFWKLTKTPSADKNIKNRQEAWVKKSKNINNS